MHATQEDGVSLLPSQATHKYALKTCCSKSLLCSALQAPLSIAPTVRMQDKYLLRAYIREPINSKQVIIKPAGRSRRGKTKQGPSKEMPDTLPADSEKHTAAPLSAAQRAKFAERLLDAQRVEDLFEVCLQHLIHLLMLHHISFNR